MVKDNSAILEIGRRVKMYRTKAGITQGELADILKTTQQQVAKYENGVQEIPASRLKQIAEALHLDPGDLLR